MPIPPKPLITHGHESPAYWQLGHLWQIMATGVQTENAFTFLDQIVSNHVGGGPVTHTHTQHEGLYVRKGQATFNAGGVQGMVATAGTFVAVPKYTEHSFTVDDPETHLLNFYLPAGFEQLLIGIARPATERALPPPEKTKEYMAPPWLAEKLSEDYGQESILGNPFVDKPSPEKMLTKPTPGAKQFSFTSNSRDLPSFPTSKGRASILASGEQTGGAYCLLQINWSKGIAIPPRKYREKREIIYILEGQLSFEIDGRVETVTTGALVYIPPGSTFKVEVLSDEAHCLNIHMESGFDELWKFDSGVFEGGKPEDGATQGVRARMLEHIGLVEIVN